MPIYERRPLHNLSIQPRGLTNFQFPLIFFSVLFFFDLSSFTFSKLEKYTSIFLILKRRSFKSWRICEMAMRWSLILCVASVTWKAVMEWFSTCYAVADHIAHSLLEDEENFHID